LNSPNKVDANGALCGSIATGETLTLSNNKMFVDSAIGVGLLWSSPFGPLRFDLAYPITHQRFDRKQVFRFALGRAWGRLGD
jgi:outer membrane protein assembly factor BamA